jgi:hypothetical protein
MISKLLFATILSVGAPSCVCFADPPLACNLNALTRVERPRHQQLTKLWQSAVMDRRELGDGYSFRIDPSKISIGELAQWIAFEHKCCPFFRFRLEVDEHDSVRMTLSGGEGVKEFIVSNSPRADNRR